MGARVYERLETRFGVRVLAVSRTGLVVDGVVEITPGTDHETIPVIPTGLRT